MARRLPFAIALTLACGCQPLAGAPGLPHGASLAWSSVIERPADASGPVAISPAGRPPDGRMPDGPATPAASSASGRGAQAEGVVGRVLSIGASGEAPLAGATITLSDGQAAVTGADGAFELPRAPADGVYLAAATGHVSSTVAGYGGSRVTLRLQPRGAARSLQPNPLNETPFQATGRLVDRAGDPVAGVDVVLGAEGAIGLPATTDAEGRFSMPVFAFGRSLTDATLLALGGQGVTWVGQATGLSCSAEAPAIDFGNRAGDDPLVLSTSSHRLRVEVDASAVPSSPSITLFLRGPNGQRLAVAPSLDGSYPIAPSADYVLEVAAEGDGWRSVVVREQIPFSAADSSATLRVTLLAAPTLALDAASGNPLASVRWEAVAGAKGYWLTLADMALPGLAWEAFTAGHTLNPPALGSGEYRLTTAALDSEGLEARQVASVRRLVFTPGARGYRQASRDVIVRMP